MSPRLRLLATLLLGPSACSRPASTGPPSVTQSEWSRGRASLAAARAELPSTPYVLTLAVIVREPRTGMTLDARGGLAVDPGKSLRLQLVGPGGATALDAWMSGERFRFEVPSARVVRRGRLSSNEAEGLPVGFFRFWFLSRLEGRLLFARPTSQGTYFILRDRDATVEMWKDLGSGHVEAERREGGRLEQLTVLASSSRARPGDLAVYREQRTGLRVEVRIEGVGEQAPDPAAFQEPSDEGIP